MHRVSRFSLQPQFRTPPSAHCLWHSRLSIKLQLTLMIVDVSSPVVVFLERYRPFW